MSRGGLDSSTAAESAKPSFYACHLFKIVFPSTTLTITDFGEPVAFGGETYSPAAKVLGFSGYEENTDLHPRRVQLDLAVTQDIVDALTGDAFQGSLVNIWIATISAARTLVGTPYNVASNLRMSTGLVTLEDGTGTAQLSCETRDVYSERDSQALCTNASQQLRYAGDTSMKDLAVTADKVIDWGGKAQPVGTPPGGAPGNTFIGNPNGPGRRVNY